MATKTAPKKLATLNALIKEAAEKRIEAAGIKAQLAILTEEQKELEQRVLDAMLESGTDQLRVADTGSYSVKRSTVPNVTDWAALDKYILKNKALDLLHRRLTATAWLARQEAGEEVPGVEAATVTTLMWRGAK